jgi:kynurenine formamidase
MPVFPGFPEPTFRPIASVPDDGLAMTELPTRSQVVVAPIKLARGNGGPARIFALLPDEHSGP